MTGGRIDGLDAARGLAVVGMFAAHTLRNPPLEVADPSTWAAVVDGRSSILFATLAGVAVALLSGGGAPATGEALVRARLRILVRACLVFAIGSALTALGAPIAVILEYTAVLMALGLIVLTWSARTLFVAAGIAALAGPVVQRSLAGAAEALPPTVLGELVVTGYYPVAIWVAFLLAGLGVGRLDLRDRATALRLAAAGAALAVAGPILALAGTAATGVAVADPVIGEHGWATLWSAGPHSGGIPEVIGSGGVALAVIGIAVSLPRPALAALAPIRAVGALALSVYSAHVVVLALIPVPAGGDPALLAWLVAGAVAFAWPWRTFIGRGPLEQAVHAVSVRASLAPRHP